MRIHLRLEGDPTIELPLGYNEILQGFVYNLLSHNLASQLHDGGFFYKKRAFKLFTFSRLRSHYEIDPQKKKIYFQTPIELKIAFALDNYASNLGLNAIKSQEVRLGKNPLRITYIEIEESPIFQEDSFIVQTLSPICVFTTPQKKKIYLSPTDAKFSYLLKENIKKKYYALTQKEEDFPFHIEPAGRYKMVAVRYKGGAIKGTYGRFKIECPPHIFQAVYDAGLGANSSLGFGMVEVKGASSS